MAAIAQPRAGAQPRLQRWPSAEQWLFVGALGVVLLLVAPPLITLLRASVMVGMGAGKPGVLSLQSYVDILTSRDLSSLVGGTLVFSAGTTALGLMLGGGLAWCVERTNTPFKGLVYPAIFVSFAVPGVLRAIGWVFLLGPRTGAINQAFRGLFQTDTTLLSAYSMPAMVLVESLFWVPVVFLMLAASFRSMDPALEEAAVLSGASVAQTMRRVTAPLARPAMLSALLLIFMRTLQAFEVPFVLGVPGHITVLTTEVYLNMRSSLVPEYSQPSAYGVLMLVFLGVLIWLYSRSTRSAAKFATVSGKGFRPAVLALGRGRALTGGFILTVVTLQFLPILYLVFASFLPTFGLDKPLLEQFTTSNYGLALHNSLVLHGAINSFLVAFVSATVVVIVTAIVAWLLIRSTIPAKSLLDQLTSLPLVFPGVVLGLAVLVLYIGSPIPVYGTIWILVIAYVTGFLPYGLRYAHPGLLQIHRNLEESAHISGASWPQTFRRVLLPLLRPALFAAWLFVFLISLRELSVAALLYTAQSPVIATAVLDLWQNGNVNQVSAFGTMVAVGSIAFAIGAYRFSRRWGIQG